MRDDGKIGKIRECDPDYEYYLLGREFAYALEVAK